MKQILVVVFTVFLAINAFSQSWTFPTPKPVCSTMVSPNCTIIAVNDGFWDDASTWNPARIPVNNDIVCIPMGRIVDVKNPTYTAPTGCPTATFDPAITPNLFIFICGTLNFQPSGKLNLGIGGFIQIYATQGKIEASNGNSDLIKMGCTVVWDGTYDVNGPYYISPIDQGPGILPVAFHYFKAEQKSPFNISLNWGTLQEVNNSNFIIERSADQKNFSAIGSVKSAGNSFLKNTYSYTDKNPASGNNYYRLKQMDEDGKVTYSETVRVINQVKKNLSLFPNPITTSTQLYSKTNFKPGERINIIDSKGTRIKSLTTNGSNSMQIDMRSFTPGLYLLQFIANGNIVETISFIKH